MNKGTVVAGIACFMALLMGAPGSARAQWVQPERDDPGEMTQAQKNVEAEIVAFRKSLREAVDKKDLARLKQYIAENYVGTLGTGWVFDRPTLISYYTGKNPGIGFENLKPGHEVMRVRVYDDDTAVGTGTSTYELDGQSVAVRWLVLYVRSSSGAYKGWQEAALQMHRVPDANPGPPGGWSPPPAKLTNE